MASSAKAEVTTHPLSLGAEVNGAEMGHSSPVQIQTEIQKKLSVLERLKALKFKSSGAGINVFAPAPKPKLEKSCSPSPQEAKKRFTKAFRDLDQPSQEGRAPSPVFRPPSRGRRPPSRDFHGRNSPFRPPSRGRRPPSRDFHGRNSPHDFRARRSFTPPERPRSGGSQDRRDFRRARSPDFRRQRFERPLSPNIPTEARRPQARRPDALELEEKIANLSIQWGDLLDVREPKLKQLISELHQQHVHLETLVSENNSTLAKLRIDLTGEQKRIKDVEEIIGNKRKEREAESQAAKVAVSAAQTAAIPSILSLPLTPMVSCPPMAAVSSAPMTLPLPPLPPLPSGSFGAPFNLFPPISQSLPELLIPPPMGGLPDISLPPPPVFGSPRFGTPIRPAPIAPPHLRLPPPIRPPPIIGGLNPPPAAFFNLRPPPPPPGRPPMPRFQSPPRPRIPNGFGPDGPPRLGPQRPMFMPGPMRMDLRQPIRFDLRPQRQMGPPATKRIKIERQPCKSREASMDRELSELVAIIPDEYNK